MTARRPLVALIAGALILSACGLPFRGSGSGLPIALNSPNPEPSLTPTPFQPIRPTETPIPTATSTPTPTLTPTSVNPWGSFPGPTRPVLVEIPREVPRISFPEDALNVIVLGSDERAGRGGFRTDVMMIVSMNPGAGTVTLVSIPRDLYVYIPGWTMDRINVADEFGGPEMVANTILYNFGIPIHRWVRVNFSGFTRIVDTLGGIEVNSTGYVSDECGGRYYTYQPGGTYYMDGWTALCYVRMRRTSGDVDRLRRQQEVILALFRKAISLDGLSRVPELYDLLVSSLQTDITLGDALPLIPLAATVASEPFRLRQFKIDLTMSSLWREPELNSSVLLPNREAIQAMLEEAFGE